MLFSGRKQFNLYRKLHGSILGYLYPTFNKKKRRKRLLRAARPEGVRREIIYETKT
jgi:hypothetical protein